MPFLLDTNTCIDLMKGHPQVVARISANLPGECLISTITSYELHTGVAKCALPEKEQAKIDLLLKTVVEQPFGPSSAREAGRIRGLLESQGNMIGPDDVLLAAQAVTSELTLVTANADEFQRVPGLSMQNWHLPAK